MGNNVKYCVECGCKHTSTATKCPKCWRYAHSGGIVHPLPPVGEMKHDEKGYPICHICGKSFSNLSFHLRQVHELTPYAYRREFKLPKDTKLVSAELSNKHKKNYYKFREEPNG